MVRWTPPATGAAHGWRLGLAWAFAMVLGATGAASQTLDCPAGASVEGAAPPDGTRIACVLADRSQHGPSLSFYPSGERLAEATFDHGRLDGRYREWHANGQLKLEGVYRKDQKQGRFIAFYPNGKKKWEEAWDAGEQHGVALSWHRNGQAMGDMSFSRGKLHGPARTWFSDGQLQARGEFVQGARHGTWQAWWEDGRTQKVVEFDHGREISRTFTPRNDLSGDGR